MVTLPVPFTAPEATRGTVLVLATELKLAHVSLARAAAFSPGNVALDTMVTAMRFCDVGLGVALHPGSGIVSTVSGSPSS